MANGCYQIYTKLDIIYVVNEIDILKRVLYHLFNLKYGEKTCATEIVKANNNHWQENRLIKIQDGESWHTNTKLEFTE